MKMGRIYSLTLLALLNFGCVLAQENGVTSDVSSQNNETVATNNDIINTTSSELGTKHDISNTTDSVVTSVKGKQNVTREDSSKISTPHPEQSIPTAGNIPTKVNGTTVGSEMVTESPEEPHEERNDSLTESEDEPKPSEDTIDSNTNIKVIETTMSSSPVTMANLDWMHTFLSTHHFEGQYAYNDIQYLFSFVARHKHQLDYKTLVSTLYDQDGAVLEFNGTSANGHIIVFSLARIYTPGTRFPLNAPLQMTGTFRAEGGTYFTGNFTQPINTSFSWFRMNTGLGTVETGETAGTRTAIIIIIPTSIAFLGICGTVAIICWASKKGYLQGRHKSYRLFTDAQVSYESEAETIHI